MRLEDYFKNGKVYVWKETFTVIKSKRPLPDAFAVIQDKNEITVVIDQSKINEEDIIEIERDWK
ncbi:MAG: ACT domain-containing protein, partial [Candidatus Aminicenantes bacterium]|nr:ACT domain-containing protein [Candidatus Aminicenantes bacterium]